MTPKRWLILSIVVLTIGISMTFIEKFTKSTNNTPDCEQWLDPNSWPSATASDVRTCLAAGASLEARTEHGAAPLHMAAANSNVEAITALLKAGAPLEARDEVGWTPLHNAGAFGTVETITALLKVGAELEARTEDGVTPLHLAAEVGNVGTITALLRAGAELEARDQFGWTPLHRAARYGTAEAVMVLLEFAAQPNAQAKNGKMPIDLLKTNDKLKETDAYQQLSELLAIPAKAVDCDEWLYETFWSSVTANDVKTCLAAGAKLEARDKGYSMTPLHLAALNSNVEAITALLKAGADLNAQDEVDHTPLHVAAGFGTAEAVMVLLKVGAKTDTRTSDGETPLHAAALLGTAETIAVLLKADANPKARTGGGETPLHKVAASQSGNMPESGRVYKAKLLLKAGANINAQAGNGSTPLHNAVWSNINKAEMVEFLLDSGASPRMKDEMGRTPFDIEKNMGKLKGTDAYWRLNEAQFK